MSDLTFGVIVIAAVPAVLWFDGWCQARRRRREASIQRVKANVMRYIAEHEASEL